MSELPNDGIIWRSYDQTLRLVKENPRPVLAFVLDDDGTCWPFLREIFRVLPQNEQMRELLNGPCVPMLLKADALPPYLQELATLGPVKGYHIAILSPAGLTPIRIFDYVTGNPEALVGEIAHTLEQVVRIWTV